MPKIMVVEDDQSLREIYSIRLTAEGYDIVSAGDGEEALAVAVKEKPDLVLSDVMMPKISGFDMLDILRSTPETKNIKVIMMTALSSDDQRKRGESLGADKYLVKSQVGIEDVIAAVKEVLEGTGNATPAPAQAPTPEAVPTQPVAQPAMTPAPEATAVAPTPVAPEMTPQAPVQPAPVATQPVAEPVAPQPAAPVASVQPVAMPAAPEMPAPQPIQQPAQPAQPVATVSQAPVAPAVQNQPQVPQGDPNVGTVPAQPAQPVPPVAPAQ